VFWECFGLAPFWRQKKEPGKRLSSRAVVECVFNYCFDPLDDESPQDKTSREDEEQDQAELEEEIWIEKIHDATLRS